MRFSVCDVKIRCWTFRPIHNELCVIYCFNHTVCVGIWGLLFVVPVTVVWVEFVSRQVGPGLSPSGPSPRPTLNLITYTFRASFSQSYGRKIVDVVQWPLERCYSDSFSANCPLLPEFVGEASQVHLMDVMNTCVGAYCSLRPNQFLYIWNTKSHFTSVMWVETFNIRCGNCLTTKFNIAYRVPIANLSFCWTVLTVAWIFFLNMIFL